MKLSLADAFGKFGAKPAHRQRARSALAADGAVVLNCSQTNFHHPSPGVLRYEDRLSREAEDDPRCVELLARHLALARDGGLPIRMVVPSLPMPDAATRARAARTFYVRQDLIGRLVEFDGDRFVVDFTRVPEASAAPAVPR